MVTPSSTPQRTALTSPSPSQPLPDTEAVKQQAADTAQSLKGQAQETAGMAADQVKQTATVQLGSQKDRASASLNGLADSLHQAGKQLEASDQSGFFAKYAHQAAGTVEKVANHLDERDIDELIAEVEDYARQQPSIFLGGAFVLGILGARYLKSSGQRQGDTEARSSSYSQSRLPNAYRGTQSSYGTRDSATGMPHMPSPASVPPPPPSSSMPRPTNITGTAPSSTPRTPGMSTPQTATGDTSVRSAVRIASPDTSATAPRVEDADRLDALRRGDVPHQMGETGSTPPRGTSGQQGQSIRPGSGDTTRNTETR